MEQEIRSFLKTTKIVGRDLRYFAQLDSTNTHAKRLALEPDVPDGTAVIAGYQTAGRGRMERTFQSPEGKGVYLTVLLRPDLPAERFLPVTALAGVAVCDAVERICGVRPGVKWPNDLVLGGKKLCGILTELVMDPEGKPCIVLGIGVNVLQTAEDFPPEVAAIAVSLAAALERSVSCAEIAAALLEELDRMYDALKADELQPYRTAYRRDCVNLGKTVQLIGPDGRREAATALDIDENFALVVCTADGVKKTVRSGEVSVRGFYGYV